jgi:hypothetical protein
MQGTSAALPSLYDQQYHKIKRENSNVDYDVYNGKVQKDAVAGDQEDMQQTLFELMVETAEGKLDRSQPGNGGGIRRCGVRSHAFSIGPAPKCEKIKTQSEARSAIHKAVLQG